MPIVEGEKAPDFTLPDQHETLVSLSDFQGKDVIIYFYPRDDTPGCTKEACGFRDLWSQIQELGVVVLGVSPDKAKAHQRFIAKFDLPFPLLSDPDKTMLTQWDAFGEKKMYGKTVQGVMRSSVWVGPDGKVRKHWAKVTKAADHPAEVLKALQENR